MSARRQQILQEAVEIIASLGYGALSMRAVARASGIKLGALQYHFPTREELLRALGAYIADTYRASFEELHQGPERASLKELVGFVLEDAPGRGLRADRLWPQLWAMALVDPIMEELMDTLYEEYLKRFEEVLSERGAEAPRAEALALMGLLEGLTLFVGRGRRWADSAPAAGEAVYAFIEARYGDGGLS